MIKLSSSRHSIQIILDRAIKNIIKHRLSSCSTLQPSTTTGTPNSRPQIFHAFASAKLSFKTVGVIKIVILLKQSRERFTFLKIATHHSALLKSLKGILCSLPIALLFKIVSLELVYLDIIIIKANQNRNFKINRGLNRRLLGRVSWILTGLSLRIAPLCVQIIKRLKKIIKNLCSRRFQTFHAKRLDAHCRCYQADSQGSQKRTQHGTNFTSRSSFQNRFTGFLRDRLKRFNNSRLSKLKT